MTLVEMGLSNPPTDGELIDLDGDGPEAAELLSYYFVDDDAFTYVPDQTVDVAENVVGGTLFGALSWEPIRWYSDGQLDEPTFTVANFSLSGTGAELFTIDPVTGELALAEGAALDFETTSSYALTVQFFEYECYADSLEEPDDYEFGPYTSSLTIAVTDAQDPALISGTATGALTEDDVTTLVGGTLSISDQDPDDEVFQTPASLIGVYGDFTFDETTGVWTYTLDSSRSTTDALSADQVVHDQLTVTSQDGTASQIIDVTVTGANDAASISGTATGALTEDDTTIVTGTVTGTVTEGNVGDAEVTATGTISISSSVPGESPFFLNVTTTPGDNGFGSFELSGGVWVFTLDQSAVQDLDAGDQVLDTIDFTASAIDAVLADLSVT